MTEQLNLTGRWTGVYFYPPDPVLNPSDDYPATPFVAELNDIMGVVTGTTSEQDTLYGDATAILSAVDGSHDGSTLRFVKFSEAAERIEEPIHYDGTISADGLTIHGRWTIPGDWSGTFRMQRTVADEAAAVRTAATTTV